MYGKKCLKDSRPKIKGWLVLQTWRRNRKLYQKMELDSLLVLCNKNSSVKLSSLEDDQLNSAKSKISEIYYNKNQNYTKKFYENIVIVLKIRLSIRAGILMI